ncbi:acyltransferase domain-containing protein [Pseudomonas sp. 5P_5.1_Bac1]|uniref:acyltransferase domain-containing protein n=1 Tax=Pseudomonas sp. 5P_5.1_Bac1 TaxID=2971616 RepID=UPI0021C6E458|nr:acyltransferase domain-containing protein [Pseudomonas sp. 5P_5.1_Bac1]MCU1723764.1 acyltransferase domain-containing protein [Pseudomonas sp. 5P_5.1_Bac1]
MNAWLFQGQGSQRKGMGAALFPRFPALVAEADRVLGYSIERLCLEDPDQHLNQTRYTQPAIYVVSWLGWLAAREDGATAQFAAGHSVGEYAALTAAGVLDFVLGLRIVVERARLMAEVEDGGLVAVLGHDEQQVRHLLAELPDSGLAIANINSPRQIIVGGAHTALDHLLTLCAGRGIRALALKVSGPFHTPHMAVAERGFREFLRSVSHQFREPTFPVIANIDARPHRRDGLVDALSRHLSHPVQWQQVVQHLLGAGVEEFIEIGQPPILAGMLKDIREHAPIPPPPPRAVRERPLLVAALPPDLGGEALLLELARHGAMGLLDADDLDDARLRETLERYNANPRLRGRFGVRLGGTARLAEVAGLGIGCIEIAAHQLTAQLRERWPAVHWLVRLEHERDLDAGLAHADALLIAADHHLPLLLEALARRERQIRRPLIGAAGLIGSASSARAMFELGVDFIAPGAVFLLAAEAAVSASCQQQLARMDRQAHQWLSDWRYPELHSRSQGYVLDRASQAQREIAQAFYLSDDGDRGEGRRALHARMQNTAREAHLRGDASLWLFNHWRRQQAPDLAVPLPAAQLLDLLCPVANDAPSRTRP